MKLFASDNNAGVHPKVMEALIRANDGHVLGYGGDQYTERATQSLKRVFGDKCHPFFVFGGTGANIIALQALARPYSGIICTDCAHIATDECGGPERIVGCKLLTAKNAGGKLTVSDVEYYLRQRGDEHRVQPTVLSLTNATEYGTVYSMEETKALVDYAHAHGLNVHLDGARLANAVVNDGSSMAAMTADTGVDILTFGGTKNGLMFGEVILVFDEELAESLPYIRKQTGQLPSKMRFVAAQFEALMENDLWRNNAVQANLQSLKLCDRLRELRGVGITLPVQANAVFATMPRKAVAKLQASPETFFYVWEPTTADRVEVRMMTAFDTTEEDIFRFVQQVKQALD